MLVSLSLMLLIIYSSLLYTALASPYYSNSSIATKQQSSRTTDSFGGYILKGLGTGGNTKQTTSASPTRTTHSISQTLLGTGSSAPVICGSIQNYQYNSPYCTATATSTYALFDVRTNATTPAADLTTALQCWSSIATWRNSSASWWNSKIASRTWNITSIYSSTETLTYQTNIIYPSSVSTYKLCDGSPRANVRPKTEHLSGNQTFYGSFTTTLMPTFTPQPCSLTPKDCRLLYHDTDIESVDDRELLKQCGSPAHLDDDSAQCLIGGGPVELIYFPVERDNSSLCTNKTSSGPVSLRPLMPGVSEITTLGHTFSSNSVYVSFKTLYASYDGFWDKIGPTFSDYIVPLQSSDISTHCGGWWGAVHNPIGTALTYADLNWPVAASAYSCQNRCSDTFSRSYSLDKGIIGAQLVSIASPPQCSTIWSDVNPVLAFPTKIRDMVPEWKSCSFWNENLANFWFDPPIALQPASAAATPTLPTSPKSTAAAAAPTPTSPTASSTVSHLGPTETHTQSATQSEAHSPQQTTIEASNAVPDTTTERQDDPIITTSGDASVHTTQVPQFSFSFDPEEPTLTSSGDIIIPTTQASQVSFTLDPEDPTDAASNGAQSIVHTNPSDGNTQGATILDPSIATAPAFSILTEALSTFASAETATRETPTTPGATGVLLSFESFTATLLQTSDHYVLGLATLTVGQTATVSSVPVVAGPDGIIIGSSTALVSELSPSQTLQPSMPSLTFAPSPTVIQAGEILLTPIDAGWNIITFASTEITRSGAAISSGDAIITYGPNGLVLVSSGSTVPFTEVDQTTAAEKTLVADLGSTTQTLTATAVGSGNALDGDVLQVGTQTISRNGGVAVNDATTYSYGSEGLEIIASNTQLTMQTLGVKSNATSASLPIVVMSTSSSSTTESRYWPTETAVSTTTASGAASSRSIWRLSCVLASLWFFFQQLDGV